MINNENLSINQMNSKSGAVVKSKGLKGKTIEETSVVNFSLIMFLSPSFTLLIHA